MRTSPTKSLVTRSLLATLTVWSVSLIIWPLIWAYVLKEHAHNPAALFGLILPMVMLCYDICVLVDSDTELNSKRGALTMDANTICSLTLALSGILGSQHQRMLQEYFHGRDYWMRCIRASHSALE